MAKPRASSSPEPGPPREARRTRGNALRRGIRQWAPWAVATLILAYILATTPRQALLEALAAVSPWQLGALLAGVMASVVLIDTLVLWLALRASMPDRPLTYRAVLVIRGASSLLALLNYGAGQGGIVYFLRQRHQVPLNAGAGAVVLTNAAFLMALALALGAGLLAGAVPDHPELRVIAWAALALLPLYLLVVVLRPRALTRRRFLRPLFGLGLGAVAQVAGARALHLFVLIAGHWLAMRLFGVDVPPVVALVRLPVMFVITSLPISPAGLGTAQAAAITLFAPFAVGADEAARQATVLAYSLSCHTIGIACLFAIGLVCLRKLQQSQQE